MNLFIFFVFAVVALWAFERFYLRGGRIARFPVPPDPEVIRSFADGRVT